MKNNDGSKATNYRLNAGDISYIFQHSEVDSIIVDEEFVPLLAEFRKSKPEIPLLVDWDKSTTTTDDGQPSGPFDEAVREGLRHDEETGGRGWAGLDAQVRDDESLIALSYTSGTTARPKGVEYTHRGAYLAALGNALESGLNLHDGRCRYLWTLPMFHAMGE